MVALKYGPGNSDLPEKAQEVLQILGKSDDKILCNKILCGDKCYEEISITPRQAEEIVKFNSELNRKINDRRVVSLRKNIKEYGYCTIDPICFDGQWDVRNGQHRLTALARLKKEKYNVLFAFNVPDDDLVFADMGMGRTVSQQMTMMGVENGCYVHPVLKGILKGQYLKFKDESSWDRAKNLYEPSQQFSAKEVESIYLENKNAFDFVINLFCLQRGGWRGKKKSEAIKGVFFRAWHHENHEMLKEFIRLYKGDIEDGDDPRYIKLTRAFEAKIEKIDCQTRAGAVMLYKITESAVHRFCSLGKNEKVGSCFKFTPHDYELYPVAEFDRTPSGKSFNQANDDD